MIFLWNLAFFLAMQILYILVFYIIVIYCHELFQLYFITCKHVVSYAYYPGITFYPCNYENMQTLSVQIRIYVIALYVLFVV